MVINLRDVSWRREQEWILKDVDWKITQEEHWVLLGLNGSGKTTLLNIINGYIWPSHGDIEVLGKKFGEFDLRELRKSIGWVSSSLQERLYKTETAEDIVVSGRYATIGLYEKPADCDYEIAHEHMHQLGCKHLATRIYSTLSQGEKQKVLIARALMSSPQLLILDEPCSGLDVFSRENLLYTIEHLAKTSSITLIYVTHHIEEIMPVFNRTLLLRRGEVHSSGATQDIITSEKLSDFFENPVEVEWQEQRAMLKIVR